MNSTSPDFSSLVASVNPGFDAYQINCTGFSSSPASGVSFVLTSEQLDKPQERELAGCCAEVVAVPVRSEILSGHGEVLKLKL